MECVVKITTGIKEYFYYTEGIEISNEQEIERIKKSIELYNIEFYEVDKIEYNGVIWKVLSNSSYSSERLKYTRRIKYNIKSKNLEEALIIALVSKRTKRTRYYEVVDMKFKAEITLKAFIDIKEIFYFLQYEYYNDDFGYYVYSLNVKQKYASVFFSGILDQLITHYEQGIDERIEKRKIKAEFKPKNTSKNKVFLCSEFCAFSSGVAIKLKIKPSDSLIVKPDRNSNGIWLNFSRIDVSEECQQIELTKRSNKTINYNKFPLISYFPSDFPDIFSEQEISEGEFYELDVDPEIDETGEWYYLNR